VTRQHTRGLRAGARGGGADRGARRVRAGLVVTEIALAVALLMGAGLLLRSLVALTQVAPGFIAEDTMAFRIALFGRGYDWDRVRTRVSELESDLRALPGVTEAAATSVLPLSGPGQRLTFSVEGAPAPPPDVNPEIGVALVAPDYFRTIGARVVRGRHFTDRDHAEAPPAVILNEAAVRRWFPDADPIGKRVHMNGSREVVGVVGDVLQGDPKQGTAPQLFVPYAQRPSRSVWIVLRTAGHPSALAPSVRATVHRLDPNLALSELTSLDQLRAGSVARPRFYAALLALFAAVALALAATGIFGVMSYAVAERTREIGIRMALGAQIRDVRKMFLRHGLSLTTCGIALGIGVAVVLARVMSSFLFGVGPMDPTTYAAVSGTLAAVALIAAYLPARRASRVDPVVALRANG
jgi:putative ABC transport system permease protein